MTAIWGSKKNFTTSLQGVKLLRGFKKLNLIPFKNLDPKERRRWRLFCDSFEK